MRTSPNRCREIRRRVSILGYGRAAGRAAFAVIFGLLLCCGGLRVAREGRRQPPMTPIRTMIPPKG